MVFSSTTALSVAAAALAIAPAAFAVTNYPNDFVNPQFILNGSYPASTVVAQQTVVAWATQLHSKGLRSVTTKEHLPPSGDNHDYMSWKPYMWPDCSTAGNTTVLTVDQMFKTCNYVNFDGKLNPDARLINNIGDFDDLANTVLFNALSWGITRSKVYSQHVVQHINAWFLDPNTYMNPNLVYSQMSGGPNGQQGTHTGILDLKSMAKIASGVALLREGNAEGWDQTVDQGLRDWVAKYIQWLTTNEIALQEKAATNNHGSFYYTQLASLYVIAGDKANAAATADEYFKTLFMGQIDANGDQPLESARTRPYHYLAYNLAAIITTGRIAQYAGSNYWSSVSTAGGTIEGAAKYAMQFPPGADTPDELYPVIGAIASIYGDPDGSYAQWLQEKSKGEYVADASFLWNQPLGDSGVTPQRPFVTYAGAAGAVETLSAGVLPSGGTNAPGHGVTNSAASGAPPSPSDTSAGGKSGARALGIPCALALICGVAGLLV